MSNDNDRRGELVSNLKRIRDELALKAHLGKAEAQQEWERLEKQWSSIEKQLGDLGAVASDTASNVGEALKLAAEELKAGYERYQSRS